LPQSPSPSHSEAFRIFNHRLPIRTLISSPITTISFPDSSLASNSLIPAKLVVPRTHLPDNTLTHNKRLEFPPHPLKSVSFPIKANIPYEILEICWDFFCWFLEG